MNYKFVTKYFWVWMGLFLLFVLLSLFEYKVLGWDVPTYGPEIKAFALTLLFAIGDKKK